VASNTVSRIRRSPQTLAARSSSEQRVAHVIEQAGKEHDVEGADRGRREVVDVNVGDLELRRQMLPH
jgi:hypothetical protein